MMKIRLSVSRFMPLLIVMGFTHCASNPNKAKDIDTKLDTKGNYQGSKIGLNENKEVVVQTETAADDELRQLSWRNYDLEKKIAASSDHLTRCRNEVADPRLGGSGQVTEIPEVDSLKPMSSVKEELGLTETGGLAVVKKEMYAEILKSQRKYEESLRLTSKTVEKAKNDCDREMGYVRVKHGLPAQRYAAKGYYQNGRYVQSRAPEHNLDEAFAIASKEAAKSKKADEGDDVSSAP